MTTRESFDGVYVYPRSDGTWTVSDGSTIWFLSTSKPTAVKYAKIVAEHYGQTVEILTKPLYPLKHQELRV